MNENKKKKGFLGTVERVGNALPHPAIIFLLLNNIFFAAVAIPFGEIMLYICLFFTIYSGADYFIKGRYVFKDTND